MTKLIFSILELAEVLVLVLDAPEPIRAELALRYHGEGLLSKQGDD